MENNSKPISINAVVEKIFTTFGDPELRTFVCGKRVDEDEKRDFENDLKKNSNELFSLFFGITNAIYAYLVASFSDKMTRELAFANDRSKALFSVERVEDALFGLYDTYDATDDLIKFVVFNVALAVKNDLKQQNEPNLQKDLGFEQNFPFNERLVKYSISEQDNLLSIFRWMFTLRKLLPNVRVAIINDSESSKQKVIGKLLHLMEYAAFFSNISLRKDEDNENNGNCGSYNFVLQSGKTLKSNYVVFKKGIVFFLLRSIETDKDNEHSMLLKYTRSNESESSAQMTLEMIDSDAAESISTMAQIRVRSTGKTYSEITNGLIRKRSRSTFCGGLSGYKYYAELAASIIDAIESNAKKRTGKSVVTYLLPLIQDPKNFSVCKDECVCTRPSCREGDMKLCQGHKRFDSPDFDQNCLSNMRLLPILTLLLIVVGSKSILPQVFACVVDNPNPDDLFNDINMQLSMRFTAYRPQKVKEDGEQIYNNSISKSSLTLKNNIPNQLRHTLFRLKARAYTVAIVDELERIENSFENGDAKKTHVKNVNNYSIKEIFDAMDEFLAESSAETREQDVTYAKQCLRQVLVTILCYYRGLSQCMATQFQYEIELENNLKDDKPKIGPKDIEKAFFEGVQEERKRIEGADYQNNPVAPSFYDLFQELKFVNSAPDFGTNINMVLGRDMVNTRELFRIVELRQDRKTCLINVDGKNEIIDLDGTFDSAQLSILFRGIKKIIGYFYDRNTDRGIGIYPQVLTFSSTTINRDGNIIRKFMFSTESRENHSIREKEYNVFSFFDYEINKRYFFVPPKKYENSNWLTHPILIGCSEFFDAVFGDAE